ncbi:MAG: hypothetical protein OEY89_00350 [Gammaproteobacteria bacterium]|nr:hypothetical protein [Gammaproteobacteria bacterium]
MSFMFLLFMVIGLNLLIYRYFAVFSRALAGYGKTSDFKALDIDLFKEGGGLIESIVAESCQVGENSAPCTFGPDSFGPR